MTCLCTVLHHNLKGDQRCTAGEADIFPARWTLTWLFLFLWDDDKASPHSSSLQHPVPVKPTAQAELMWGTAAWRKSYDVAFSVLPGGEKRRRRRRCRHTVGLSISSFHPPYPLFALLYSSFILLTHPVSLCKRGSSDSHVMKVTCSVVAKLTVCKLRCENKNCKTHFSDSLDSLCGQGWCSGGNCEFWDSLWLAMSQETKVYCSRGCLLEMMGTFPNVTIAGCTDMNPHGLCKPSVGCRKGSGLCQIYWSGEDGSTKPTKPTLRLQHTPSSSDILESFYCFLLLLMF